MKNYYIVGTGRWANVYFKILKKFSQNIYFISERKNKVLRKNKKIFKRLVVDYKKIKYKKKDIIILTNKNKNRRKYLNFFLKKNINILYEKPFLLGLKMLKKILNLSKKNNFIFFISSPWCFSKSLKKISKIINFKKIKRVEFIWKDKVGEKKYGLVKKIDTTIPYINDISHHIISIFFVISRFKKINQISINKKNRVIKIYNKEIKYDIDYNANKCIRKIILFYQKNKCYELELNKKITLYDNSKLIFQEKQKLDEMKTMLIKIFNNKSSKFKFHTLFSSCAKISSL